MRLRIAGSAFRLRDRQDQICVGAGKYECRSEPARARSFVFRLKARGMTLAAFMGAQTRDRDRTSV
jgi:hypothetical protein